MTNEIIIKIFGCYFDNPAFATGCLIVVLIAFIPCGIGFMWDEYERSATNTVKGIALAIVSFIVSVPVICFLATNIIH